MHTIFLLVLAGTCVISAWAPPARLHPRRHLRRARAGAGRGPGARRPPVRHVLRHLAGITPPVCLVSPGLPLPTRRP
ncbi:MAG: hypothetical protein ACLSHC_05220 [Bilophila wadsworthia]